MKYLKIALLVIPVTLIIVFGGNSDSAIDYSGNYQLFATSTTENNNYGQPCVGAKGIINVSNSIVTGRVITDGGNVLDVNGEVTSSGQISGGFAIADLTAASYEDKLYANGGNGNWDSIYGCSGIWAAEKKS